MDVAKRRATHIPELFDTGILTRWDQEALWNFLVATKGDRDLVYATLTPPTTEPAGPERVNNQDRPLMLLSLDGGGIRGLSSIMILQHIMAGINLGRVEDDQLKPYQVFDLIGGTSTGGYVDEGETAVRFKRTAIAEYLIQQEADVEAENHESNNLRPLHVAAEQGDAEGVFLLIRYHAQTEVRSGLGLTPLMHAAWKDNAAALRALVESNALIEAGLEKGERTAAIPGIDIERRINERSTALLLAAQSGHIAIVKLLVEKRADLEARTDNDETPLIAASIYGHVRVVQYLLEKGSNAEARTRGTFTALIFAANRDHPEVIRTLIEFGALVDSKKSHGMTALMEAIYAQSPSATQLLVEKGASLVETADSILGVVGDIVDTLGKDVKKRREPGLLEDLSPELVDLLNRLGLVGLSPPVGDIVDTLGKDVKRRQAPGLLEDLSPELVALLTSLGLGGLAPPVRGIVTTAGQDV
ncbi:hypothetical protein D6D06_05817 [Aureobasidium pullulans]|nr:hypothetical protein D6D06_05817 [Aureobasidium pullulans]